MAKNHSNSYPTNPPSLSSFGRCGQWMSAEHQVHRDWLGSIIKDVDAKPNKELHPVIQEFQQLIETTPRVYMLLESMFEEIPHKPPYNKDLSGHPRIRDYRHFLQTLNHLLTTAPSWNDKSERVGLVGLPISALLDWPMGTPSGHAAFLDPDINAIIKKVLNAWSAYLRSSESAYVLDDSPSGWFGPHSRAELAEVARVGACSRSATLGGRALAFEEMFVCDPSALHHGYKSWDDFFTRKFHENARPVALPDDDNVIVNACESQPYCVQRDVKARDKFWLKHQPYSVLDMLAHNEFAPMFVGGTVYQAFLNALSYHRWHAPVSGKVVKAYVVDGTYYSEPLFEVMRSPADKQTKEGEPETEEPVQGYLTATATRALIFIEADNPAIGLMCFIGVGMTEVSTCEITVKEGQHIKKGAEIGMFHYGGSTYCLIFRKGVNLTGLPCPDTEGNVPVRSQLATVHP
ncbi:hypothetical protein BGZ51_008938 [Haplosporangium sp. Z 767]|nr:hypothetical protein BGZ50_009202 [Haplosporangium sp. Z 11]KAF9177264.1 hypothetical protein BGZ51_008938 [Haplosporangium sp. Z 767]